MNITKEMISNLMEIPGYNITHNLGLIEGTSVKTCNFFLNIWVSFRSIFGGEIKTYTKLSNRAKKTAFNELMAQAHKVGANAVVGVRYEVSEMRLYISSITKVIAYGTAVLVEKK